MSKVIESKESRDELFYERCCGLDVHKKMIVACLRDGRKLTIKEFGTMSKDLREMADWLSDSRCQMAAMESTGSYWKPVFNMLEALGVDVIVVNAWHLKNVPGRKTDVLDAEWIAKQLSLGNLRASYVPDKEQRELREVSRYRKSLKEERAREINRLQKILEGANIKLASVVDDILGSGARALLHAAADGVAIASDSDVTALSKRLRGKAGAIVEAMDGVMTAM
jgi:transposase